MADWGKISRRGAVTAGVGGAAALLWNFNSLTLSPDFAHVFHTIEDWTEISQRALLVPQRLAPEYAIKDISPTFKPNGTINPGTDDYNRHVSEGFAQLAADNRWHGAKALVAFGERSQAAARANPDHQT